jgi:hypothetical protein
MRLVAVGDVLENEGRALTRLEFECRADVAAVQLDPGVGFERQAEARGLEQGPVRVALRPVGLATVVEARRALELEVHPAAHRHDATDEPLAVRAPRAGLPDRHEVLHLANPVGGEEARDQHVAVREVHLLRLPARRRGPQRKVTAAVGVEDRGEHARRVEIRAAVPVDRAVVPTSAAVCRSPIRPCSAIGR